MFFGVRRCHGPESAYDLTPAALVSVAANWTSPRQTKPVRTGFVDRKDRGLNSGREFNLVYTGILKCKHVKVLDIHVL